MNYKYDQLRKWELKYRKFFRKAKVLELGSGNAGGVPAVRVHFKGCEYVGVDCKDKPNVDIKCFAHETNFKKDHFDTLVSFSMFEHDPYWLDSIRHNLPFLRKGGMIFFKWSVKGSPHGPQDAADNSGKFYPVPLENMTALLNCSNVKIIETIDCGTTCCIAAQKL